MITTFLLLLFAPSSWALESPFQFLSGDDVISETGHAYKKVLPATINALVWNTYKGREEGFSQKYQHLLMNADLVLLQEFTDDTYNDKLSSENQQHQYIYASTFKFLNKKKGGVATASKSPTSIKDYQFSDGIYGVIPPKATLFTSYRIAGQKTRLLVVNIHAKNFASQYYYEEQIDNIYGKIKKHDGPILFGGDFNSWSKDRFEYIKDKLAGLDLKMLEFDVDNDHRMKAPAFLSNNFEYFNYPLDNIFYRGFDIENAKTLKMNQGSDHGAITFRMVFNKYIPTKLEKSRRTQIEFLKTWNISQNIAQQLISKYEKSSFTSIHEESAYNKGQIGDSVYDMALSIIEHFIVENKLAKELLLSNLNLELNGLSLKEALLKALLIEKLIPQLLFDQLSE